MTNAKRKPFLTTRELATVAILAAISAVLFMIEIPVVLFYKLDLSHLPVLLGILCAIWRAAAAKRKEYLQKEARDTLTVHYQKEADREP